MAAGRPCRWSTAGVRRQAPPGLHGAIAGAGGRQAVASNIVLESTARRQSQTAMPFGALASEEQNRAP